MGTISGQPEEATVDLTDQLVMARAAATNSKKTLNQGMVDLFNGLTIGGGGIGADVASASALPLLNDGQFVNVTGAVDIDTMDSVGVGKIKTLRFLAVLTINHDNIDLDLYGSGSITTSVDDMATFVEYATGDWRLINYSGGQSATQVRVFASLVITSGGLLTIAHNLNAEPSHYQAMLECQTAEHGWSIGDRQFKDIGNEGDAGTNRINTISFDSTNVYLRFASPANCFQVGVKTTGVAQNITNANWRIRLWLWR